MVVLAGGATLVIAAAVIVARWFLFDTSGGSVFLSRYPGITPLPETAPVGIPVWLNWQHFLNGFFMLLIVKTGWMLHRGGRPVALWQRRRSGPGTRKIAIELWAHISIDALWMLNGVAFIVLLFSTGHWMRVVPTSWSVVPNAVSAALQYMSLQWPTEDGWANYNSLQLLAYFVTIFIAAPVAALTGWRMSPLWPARPQVLSRIVPIGLARALHFPTMIYFAGFVVVHVALVLLTGARRNLGHMYWSSPEAGWWGAAMFLLSCFAMVLGWLATAPAVLKRVGSVFGAVTRS